MRSAVVAILVLVVLTLAQPRLANADDQAAARAFEEGSQAFAAGDFHRAADAFERAYAERPHHDALWNAARARQRSGDDVRAANLYARYLREAPGDARDRDTATSSLTTLAKSLSKLELHRGAGLKGPYKLDGESLPDQQQESVWTTPGDHVVEVAGVQKAVHVEAGAILSVTLEEHQPPPPPSPAPIDSPKPFPWTVIAIGGGLTLIAGGITTWSAINTVDQKDVFDKNRSQANLDEGKDRQTRTNILIGVTAGIAAVTAITTALIVFSTPNKKTSVAFTPTGILFRGEL